MDHHIPEHVAIIMDGNGRWAKKRHLPRTAGHLQGTKNIRNITIKANELGIKSLTLYAFSTENWNRPMDEIDYIMHLPKQFFINHIDELVTNNIKINLVGEIERIPEYARQPIEQSVERTKNNTGLHLNLAMNYGGRRELVVAMQNIIRDGYTLDQINEQLVGSYLMTSNTDVDLLIRTSGEIRISNFLLWQLAYSEMVFVDTLWPEFDEICLVKAIEEYQLRNRRFGGI